MPLYCDAAKLVEYFDNREIRSLLSDTGQSVDGNLANDPKLAEMLKSASGRLEGACFVSENYSAEELASMSENSLALAAEICANLTMGMLMRRRIGRVSLEQCQAITDHAEDYLQQLRNGARLFDVGRHAEAGKPSISWPTPVQLNDLNAITSRTQNFYPSAASRLPISRQGG